MRSHSDDRWPGVPGGTTGHIEPAASVHCTLAVTDAVAFNVSVHVFVLFPPLEHAPDQMASRPLETLSVTAVPAMNDADPVEPTATLMPAGLDVTRSPLRPVAVTDNVTG